MYTFIIKDKGPDLDLLIIRALLALASLASLLYHPAEYKYLHLISAATLLIAAVFIKLLLEKLRINKFVLLSCAALLLFLGTHAIFAALILLVNGYLIKFLHLNATILINENGVTIKKLLTSPMYPWNEFSNIVLKDNLLTLDFKNNKLVQLVIDETREIVNESAFNGYCKAFILPVQTT